MKERCCLVVLAIVVAVGSVSSVSADTIYFNDFTHSGGKAVDWLVTINDDTAGVFTVNVSVANASPNKFADITGIAFSIQGALDAGLQATDIWDITPNSDFVRSYTGPSDKFGSGQGMVNFKGGSPKAGLFDAALGYTNGGEFLDSVQFTVSTLAGTLKLEDWTKFGVRGHRVGSYRSEDGESTDWSMSRSAPLAVPTPSAFVGLLGMGLAIGGLRLWRRP